MKSGVRILVALLAFCLTSIAHAQTGTTRVVNGKTYLVHKVASGETLYKISKKYGCTVKELEDANKLGTGLKAGQDILVPTGKTTAPVITTPKASSVNHTVVKGETLSKIARDNNTTVDAIKKLNNLTSENVRIGQVLKVPTGAVETMPEVLEEVKTEGTPENTKPAEPVEKPAEKVKPADKQPAGPRQTTADQKPADKTRTQNGDAVSRSTEVVLAETATEKEENTMARLYDQKLDQTRTYVVHPTLPKGSIIVVINQATGKMAYCRVMDNVKTTDLNGAGLGITKAVAEKIGLEGQQGSVQIKYAAP